MRYACSIFLLLFFTLIGSGQAYELEDKMLACLLEVSSSMEHKLEDDMSYFENQLIEKGLLESNSAQHYYAFLQLVEKEPSLIEELKLSGVPIVGARLIAAGESNPEHGCALALNEIFESGDYESAKLRQIIHNIESKHEDILAPSAMLGILAKEINVQDLEHGFYRYFSIIMLLHSVRG